MKSACASWHVLKKKFLTSNNRFYCLVGKSGSKYSTTVRTMI
uniref:Uncharacterized protein n=1 Tax=uncultured delta proteobacterium HF4000_08N17 TaxID=710836 RepID=E0XVI5_9DELT|nr:hypothetical protein [uncultured delta proteobacterium HF4000_08N17]